MGLQEQENGVSMTEWPRSSRLLGNAVAKGVEMAAVGWKDGV